MTMEAQHFVIKLNQQGLDLRLNREHDLELYGANENLSQETIRLIKANKAEIVNFLLKRKADAINLNINPIEEQDFYGLSKGQQRLWIIDQMDTNHSAYLIFKQFSFSNLDVKKFQLSIDQLICRHESLRTIFPLVHGKPVQKIVPFIALDIEPIHFDLKQSKSPQKSLENSIKAELYTPFDITSEPAIRIGIFHMPNNEYQVILVIHHIISDALSMDQIAKDFLTVYEAPEEQAETVLSPLAIQYKDYAAWQTARLNDGFLEEAKRYWVALFENKKDKKWSFSKNKNHEGEDKYLGEEIRFSIYNEQFHSFLDYCRTQGISLFSGLTALLKILFYAFTKQTDVAIGFPVAGRSSSLLENQVGFYVNTLVLDATIASDDSFLKFAVKTNLMMSTALEYQELPFDYLVESLNLDLGNGSPIFNVFSSYLKGQGENHDKYSAENPRLVKNAVAKFELSVDFVHYADSLQVTFNYLTGCYASKVVQMLAINFEKLLSKVLVDPDQRIMEKNYFNQLRLDEFHQNKDARSDENNSFNAFKKNPDNKWSAKNIWGESQTTNQALIFLCEGKIDEEMMHQSLIDLIKRQEIMKYSGPTSKIFNSSQIFEQLYRVIDFTTFPSNNVEELAVEKIKKALLQRFDIDNGPNYFIIDVKLDKNKSILAFIVDNKSFKNWQPSVIQSELEFLLNINNNWNENESHQIKVINQDLSTWIHNLVSDRGHLISKAYWSKLLKTAPEKTAIPHDRLQIHNGEKGYATVGLTRYQGVYQDLLTTCKASGDEIIVALSAITNCLLYKYTGNNNLIVGVENKPPSGISTPLLDEVYPLITTISGEESLSALLLLIRDCYDQSLPHQKFPIFLVLKELGLQNENQQNPLFNIVVSLETTDENASSANDLLPSTQLTSKQMEEVGVDLLLKFNQFENQLGFSIVYNKKLFKPSTIDRMLSHFTFITEAFLVNPEISVKKLDFIPEDEKRTITKKFRGSLVDFPSDKQVHQLIALRATTHSNAVAVKCDNRCFTYRELEIQVNNVSQNLVETYHLEVNDIVAIALDPSINTIPLLLGILKAGCAFLPIDPSHPKTFIEYIVQDSNAKLLVLDTEHIATNYLQLSTEIIDLSLLTKKAGKPCKTKIKDNISGNDLAYVIYTSGTTGQPKGVMVQRHSFLHYVQGFIDYFKVNDTDSVLHQSNLAFDTSIEEIFPILVAGGTLVILKEGGRDIQALKRTIKEEKISILSGTPLLINELNKLKVEINGLSTLISGGELLKPSYIDHFFGKVNIVNSYGPTESTVCATYHKVTKLKECGLIGRPIANTTVYILDDELNLLPIGITGQLYVSGPGVAKGYIGKEQLTNERFIENPYVSGTKMYDTGDLARWLEDGSIEYIGRSDKQLKIRGFRVETGAIEKVLQEHTSVNEVIVTPLKNKEGDNELAAFIKGSSQVDEKTLRAHIKTHLPEFMVPEHIYWVENFVTNKNGKFDAEAMVKAFHSNPLIDEHPYLPIAAKLQRIWQNVLNKPHITDKDNFFDIGGHSLKAIRLLSSIYDEFKVELTLKDLLTNPTIKALSSLINKQTPVQEKTKIFPVEEQDHYLVSYAQKRLWLIDELHSSGTAYNIPIRFVINHEVDKRIFTKAYFKLIQKHEILRTRFVEVNGELRQKIDDPETKLYQPAFIDFALNKEQSSPQDLANTIAIQEQHLFDLSKAPLIKALLIKVEDQKYIVSIVLHHIIGDGWSVEILSNELQQLYLDEEQDNSTTTQLDIQYKDFAIWSNNFLANGNLDGDKDFWLDKLGGNIPRLDLPLDFKRPKNKKFVGGMVERHLPKTLTDTIKSFSKKKQSGNFASLLTLFKLLLFRYTGQNDIILGTLVSGRVNEQLFDQLGFYVNTLAIRTSISGAETIDALHENVKANLYDAIEHQNYPFDQLVEDLNAQSENGRNPIFDVLVSYRVEDAEFNPDNGSFITSTEEENQSVQSKFDLSLLFIEYKNDLVLQLIFDQSLFSSTKAFDLLKHFEQISNEALQSPSASISSFKMINDAERDELLRDFQSSKLYSNNKNIIDLIAENARRNPDAIAIKWNENQLTYTELIGKANCLAKFIVEKYNITTGSTVALMMDRSPNTIISILAVLKTGAAYLPIDTDYPKERIKYLIENSKVSFILTDEVGNSTKPMAGVPIEISPKLDKTNYDEGRYFQHKINDSDLAYIIYTSGSTGKPKGVMIQHRSLVDYILTFNDYFKLTSEDVFVQQTSFSFDVSVQEIFSILVAGGTMVLAEEGGKDLQKLLDLVVNTKATALGATPLLINELNQHAESLSSLRFLISAGDILKPEYIDNLIHNVSVYNGYGPTESTILATIHKVEELATCSNIGCPINNRPIYILDENFNLIPKGVWGEIYISGVGVAKGYIGNQALTNKKFLRDPFNESFKMYRTGDIARWTTEGTIEFLGRRDNQVKLRGYRIELGEIESAIKSYDDINASVVLLNELDPSNQYLIGYFETDKQVSEVNLRSYLSEKLPQYMIPTFLVPVNHMPKTVNGKLDKAALPAVKMGQDKHVDENLSQEQLRLKKLWEKNLGRNKISLDWNYFQIGGHSLKALRLMADIYAEYKINISLKDVLNNPTLRELDLFIQNYTPEEATDLKLSIVPIEDQEYYPVSNAQRRLWLIQHSQQVEDTYNIPITFELNYKLDKRYLHQAILSLAKRHEALRTTFFEKNGEIFQRIHELEHLNFKPAYLDFADLNHYKKKSLTLENLRRVTSYAFDLENGPLFNCLIIKLAPTEFVLNLNFHHIIMDEWSLEIITSELKEFYAYHSRKKTKVELKPKLSIQYKDYAYWESQNFVLGKMDLHKKYWLNRFSQDPQRLELPLDFSRPAVKSFKGTNLRYHLPVTLKDKIINYGIQHKSGTFVTVISLLNVWLYKLTNQNDIIIGTVVSGRNYPELQDQIGFYVNTLALRTRYRKNDNFNEWFQQTESTIFDAFDHQEFPFDHLIEALGTSHTSSRSPLFDVMASYTKKTGKIEAEKVGAVPEAIAEGDSTSKFDLSIDFVEFDNNMEIVINYDVALFEASTMRRWLSILEKTIEVCLADDLVAINALNVLPENEVKKLALFSNFTSDHNSNNFVSFPTLIEAIADTNPNSTALSYGEIIVSYTSLNQKANKLANYLLKKYAIQPNHKIGLMIERSPNTIIALLGILKTGAAYVPIDPQYPQDRKSYMINDAQLQLLVSDYDYQDVNSTPCINIHSINEELQSQSCNNPSVKICGEHLAYIIYTSGSTGKPKGAMIEHQSLSHYLLTFVDYFNVTGTDVVLQQATLSFDISVEEIFPILSVGGRLVLPESGNLDLDKLIEIIDEEHVTILSTTPLLINELNKRSRELSGLRALISGGDLLKPKHIDSLFGKLTIFNTYGPTETTVCATYHKVEDLNQCSYIGHPIPGKSVFILDEDLNQVPIGVPGEIYIGGNGLAIGYIGKTTLTAKRFINHPYADGERLYKTGDLGKWLTDGTISFLGRMDNQVKIRGFRIEPEEIAKNIKSIGKISDCLVLTKTDRHQENYLVAYYASASALEDKTIRKELREILPNYMIPSIFVHVEQFELNANGKLDFEALPEISKAKKSTSVEGLSSTKLTLLSIWKAIFQHNDISIEDDFFELGGHSIKAIQLASEINQVLGTKVSIKDIFNYPSIATFSDFLALTDAFKEDSLLVHFHPKNLGVFPNLFMIPPIFGSATIYLGLAKEIEAKRNAIGIQYKGLGQDQTFGSSIEDMASAMTKEILKVQHEGEFEVLGYSMGSNIAFEIVKNLEKLGHQTKLILVDKEVSIKVVESSEHDISDKAITTWLNAFPKGQRNEMKKFILHNLSLNNNYLTSGEICGNLLVLEASKNRFPTHMQDWKRFTKGEFIHKFLEEEHYSIFNEVNLRNLSGKILKFLLEEPKHN